MFFKLENNFKLTRFSYDLYCVIFYKLINCSHTEKKEIGKLQLRYIDMVLRYEQRSSNAYFVIFFYHFSSVVCGGQRSHIANEGSYSYDIITSLITTTYTYSLIN